MQLIVLVNSKNRLFSYRSRNQAFALIDSVIASVLLIIMAASLQSLFEISRQGIVFSNQMDQADRDIHTVINDIRNLGTTYHYCNGKAVVSTSTSLCNQAASLLSVNPQSYYSPTSSDLQNFKNNCNHDTEKRGFTDDQILNGGNTDGSAGLLGALKTKQTNKPHGVSIDYKQDNKENRRIQVTLTKTVQLNDGNGGTRTLTRQYYFSPTLALWCP